MDDREPQTLLADVRWLRGLVGRLVHDADLAEDVCQETLVAAVRHPAGDQRAWLARVARNFALAMLRRERRQARARTFAPTDEPTPATDAVVAEAEAQRAAADALMQLEEPYRTTLLLRFMKGMSVRAVARHMEVPIETVRTRQKRGLQQLRAKLDRRPGGRLSVVLPLAVPGWPNPTIPTLWGIVLMKSKLTVACAALVLLGALWLSADAFFVQGKTPTPDVSSPVFDLAATSKPYTDDVAGSSTTESESRTETAPPPSAGRKTPDADEAHAVGDLVVKLTFQDDGQPAANIGVRVQRPYEERDARPGKRLPHMATSGPTGQVLFRGIPAGEVQVALARNLYRDFEVRAGSESVLRIEVPPGDDVDGLVVDGRGSPVAGAEVLIARGGVRPQWMQVLTRTDERGRFTLHALGRFNMLGARSAGYGTSDFVLLHTAPRRANGRLDVRIVLAEQAVRVRGQVLDAAGQPARDAWVKLGKDGGSPRRGQGMQHRLILHAKPHTHVVTDAEGRFEVKYMTPGTVPLRVFATGHAPWSSELVCHPFGTNEITIRLTEGAVLQAFVLDGDGRPVAGADISLDDMTYPTSTHGTTDEQGTCRLVDLPAGTLNVGITTKVAGETKTSVELTAGRVTRHEFRLRPGLILTGVLVDHLGKPLRGWWLRPVGANFGRKTDAKGRFRITNCEDRSYDLLVHKTWGFTPSVTTLRGVRPGGDGQEHRIEEGCLPSAKVRGRIQSAAGRPLAGVSLNVRQLPHDLLIVAPDTDANGRFTIDGLPPGRYRLGLYHAEHEYHRWPDITLTRDQELVLQDVVLKRTAR